MRRVPTGLSFTIGNLYVQFSQRGNTACVVRLNNGSRVVVSLTDQLNSDSKTVGRFSTRPNRDLSQVVLMKHGQRSGVTDAAETCGVSVDFVLLAFDGSLKLSATVAAFGRVFECCI